VLELGLCVFTPVGESGLQQHCFTERVASRDAAKAVCLAFFHGTLSKVSHLLSPGCRAWSSSLGIDLTVDHFDGQVGVDEPTLRAYCPGLLPA